MNTFAMKQRSPKKKLEKDIVKEICDWMFINGYFFWRSNNVPVFQKDKYGGRFRKLPKYTPRGLPDIMLLESGRYVGIEVKVPEYWKFTDDQKSIRDKIELNGGHYWLVTSLQETIDAITTMFPKENGYM